MITALLVFVLLLAINVHGSTNDITCQNNEMEIICSGNNVIQIISANYGRTSKEQCTANNAPTHNTNCRADHVLEIVQIKCDGRQSCVIPATTDLFGDPCYGTFKYLEVEYSCIPDPHGFMYELTCSHTNLTLSCNDEKETIKIAEANFGRTTRSICNVGPIITIYCVDKGATQIAAKECDDKQTCTLPAEAIPFGDPCFGTFKYLWVKYKCEKRDNNDVVVFENI